jgi:hypothetical protein
MMSRHTPQSCPMFNAEGRKVYSNVLVKMPEALKKYGIKIVAACTVHSEHLEVYIFEAPNMESIQRMYTEPEFMAAFSVNTTELRAAENMEEGIRTFQQSASKPT